MIEKFIDIYSKLIIGVISFIAPIASYLLSTYISDRPKILAKLTEQRKTIDSILDLYIIETKSQGLSSSSIIFQANEKLTQLEKEIALKLKLVNFLNPKKRIFSLFISLFLSILFLILDLFIRGNFLNLYSHKVSICLLVISVLLFAFSLYQLWQISWRLIDAKEILAADQKEIIQEKYSVPVQQGSFNDEKNELEEAKEVKSD